MKAHFRLLSASARFVVCSLVVVFGLELAAVEPSEAATKSCWSVLEGGIIYCRGQVEFDGGGAFAGAVNEKRFRSWAASGKPQTLELNSPLTGLLRWRGKGDCLYTHGAGGNWSVWCGPRAAMAKLASDVDGEWEGEPYEVFCKVKGRIEVIDSTPLGLAYPEETCALIGGKPQ
jgi:hypothetical protein